MDGSGRWEESGAAMIAQERRNELAGPQEVLPYTASLYHYARRVTRVVNVGSVAIGGTNPIRVQSMTTTRTQDIDGTVAQAVRLVRAGCEIVRITAPTARDARAIGEVRDRLLAQGIRVPLVADIHFSPEAAMAAAEIVDKVRINPGNYADSRKFAVREYTDAAYDAELRRIEERVAPLVLKCKERDIAMRIGTNHGSLSDRVMNRFGDTPEGMVESALEFVHICARYGYHNLVLSMKASNPKVMIAAYRLLAARMAAEGLDYPFHLGVTEAGNGEDGRIKSAIGIGSLLEDGIGDTIRVSLTEEPEEEIPVARAIAAYYDGRRADPAPLAGEPSAPWDPYHYGRRHSRVVHLGGLAVGGGQMVAVLADAPAPGALPARASLPMAGAPLRRGPKADAMALDLDSPGAPERLTTLAWKRPGPATTPLVVTGSDMGTLAAALDHTEAVGTTGHSDADLSAALVASGKALWLEGVVDAAAADPASAVLDLLARVEPLRAAGVENLLLSLRASTPSARLHGYRLLAAALADRGWDYPLLLVAGSDDMAGPDEPAGQRLLLEASISLGSLLCDGVGDAILVRGAGSVRGDVALSFNILQAAGARISKTDYVACPSCGRTLFDLQSTTERIKTSTSHLTGVKIAIMGCIVNGPGEMADADFGYVGGSPGHVNLYVGKECVERNVPEAEADTRLVALIKAQGKWIEDNAAEASEMQEENALG